MMDQDSAFMSSLMNFLFKSLGIKIKTVGPYNHKSLQAEHGIKSLSNILTKHLTGQVCVTQISFVAEYSVFQSELYIFPLPTRIFTKDGKTGNACFLQAELSLCFSDHVLVLLCLLRSIKGECLLSSALM